MAEIQASVNGVTAKVNPNRPSWESMHKNYPAEEITSDQFYPMVSKAWEKAVQKDKDNWENTCATRMSYALNRSGIKLAQAPSAGGTLVGDDKFNYWIRVKDLKKFLNDRFKGGDVECELPLVKNDQEEGLDARVNMAREKMLDIISGKHGIIVFDVVGWGNASGHFTLWDGENLVYVGGDGSHNDPETFDYYFWYTSFYENGSIAQTKKITFWELK